MIKNYFKIAWRNLWKNKLTSFINIFGLTISISICLLISLFIYDEVNYDTFEKDYAQIYRLEQDFSGSGNMRHWAATPGPLKDFLQAKFPEVESSARLYPTPYTFIKLADKKLKEEDCFLADSSVFETLGLTLIQGNPNTALAEPNSIVLTEKIAAVLFGSNNAINQMLLINSTSCKVTGILKDLPSTSHLKINFLGSIKHLEKSNPNVFNWISNGFYTYVKVKKNTNVKQLTDKATKALYDDGIFKGPVVYFHNFHNISKIHLDGNIEKELSQNSSWLFIYIFITIGALIILLASINYINLTTSKSLERSKEIGIRKTLGAFKKQLVAQFITESVLVTLLSFTVGLLIVFLTLPYFNSITDKSLVLSSIIHPFFLFISIGIILFIGVLAGIYPAFVISSFDPINALKGITNITINKKFSFGFRKSLVVFQFVVSTFLVISSMVVINQISFMFDKPLGYNKENLIVLPAISVTKEKLNTLRIELKKNPNIVDVSATSAVPGKRVYLEPVTFEDRDLEVLRTMCIDEDYMKTMQMEIVQGRNFDRSIASDSAEGVIINETAARNFNPSKSVLGQKLILSNPQLFKPCTILGVVKDFHQGSLHTAIEPMVFHIKTFYNSIIVRYTGNSDEAKKYINIQWTKLFPDQLFTYNMLNDNLGGLYKSESTLKQLLIIFTSFAIAIASLGLFGLIFFANILRKKEIGIRKILGAGNRSIIYLLSREYIILISISLIISIPLSSYLINKWLNNFAYRTDNSITNYFIGTFITLLIALSTVFVQGLRVAMANPVTSLKTE
jgi:putative ABC transport system permease protein